MAQTSSIYNSPLSGNLGNQTYKNYGGKQVVTTRFRTTSAKGDGASRAQRDTRMLMPNLTLVGSQLKVWLPALWESNKFFKRPYTHFISHNMKRELPVLPKELIDLKYCCWGDLQVSCGSLPPLHYYIQGLDYVLVDLAVAGSGAIDSTNWGALSRFIIDNNVGWLDGDSIVFVQVRYQQKPIGLYSSPVYSTCRISALTLNSKSSNSVANSFFGPAVPLSAYGSSGSPKKLQLREGASFSWAVVHVRKLRGQYLSSSQVMTSDHAGTDDIEYMMSQEYLDYCAASWGYKDKIL